MMKKKVLKSSLIVLALTMIFSMTGCGLMDGLKRARDSFQSQYPNARYIPVIEEPGGEPVYDAPDMDGDGKADLDANGKPLEIAGT